MTSGGFYPPDTPLATILGFKADAVGVPFPGVACNRIHVDLTVPFEVFVSKSYAGSGYASHNLFLFGGAPVPYNAAWVGAPIVVQNGWTDTGNGSVKLSAAATTIYPAMPPGSYKRNATFATDSNAARGIADPLSSTFPIVRYVH